MAWIRMIPDDEAEGSVRDAYAEAGVARGQVANILKVHGVHPQVLTAHLRLYTEVMFGRSELTRAEREKPAILRIGGDRLVHLGVRVHDHDVRPDGVPMIVGRRLFGEGVGVTPVCARAQHVGVTSLLYLRILLGHVSS